MFQRKLLILDSFPREDSSGACEVGESKRPPLYTSPKPAPALGDGRGVRPSVQWSLVPSARPSLRVPGDGVV